MNIFTKALVAIKEAYGWIKDGVSRAGANWDAKKRNEVRADTKADRGRVWTKAGGAEDNPKGPMVIKGESKMVIKGRVFRAQTNTWEELPEVHVPMPEGTKVVPPGDTNR
jgi:hypothetical protein